MSELPLFEVYSVEDGSLFGILIKKVCADHSIEHAYLYLDTVEGLRPTSEIRYYKNMKCIALVPTKYHEKLLKELRAYAMSAHETGMIAAIRRLSENYRSNETFGDILTRIFERGNEDLADLLESRSVFYSRIMQKIRTKNEVKGKAVKFEVVSPHNIFPDENLRYLRRIQSVLKMDKVTGTGTKGAEDSLWFRKTGPIAIDFEQGKVFPRDKRLADLRDLISDNPVSILEGMPATGKTVLVRNLAYNLHQKDTCSVYHFECRTFDVDTLAKEMNTVNGIIIIEDIHTCPQKFQLLYSLYDNEHSRVLLTTRPSFREKLHSRKEDLTKLPTMLLDPFENADEIIDHYSRSHPSLPWSVHDRNVIKRVSSQSFWLLAYALKGYCKALGQGEPASWVKEGVREDLKDLKNSDDPLASQYPEIVVALSPLFMRQAKTARDYLVQRLKFNQDALNALVVLGEITCEKKEDGSVLYGLPHSALAEAYWEHGGEYKSRDGLRDYESFIYDYVRSESQNILEVVVGLEDDFRDRVLAQLDAANSLAGIIAREAAIWPIEELALAVADSDDPYKRDVVNSITRKLNEWNDLREITSCISTISCGDEDCGQDILSGLDLGSLDAKLGRLRKIQDVCACVKGIYDVDLDVAWQRCDLLNVEELAKLFGQTTDVWELSRCLITMLKVNEQVGRKLWKLYKNSMATALSQGSKVRHGAALIAEINSAYPDMAGELCDSLNVEELATKLREADHIQCMSTSLIQILNSNEKTGRQLWELCKDTFAARLSHDSDLMHIALSIRSLNSAAPDMARELCGLLDAAALTVIMNEAEEWWDIARCISAISPVNEQVGCQIWRLCKATLADRIIRGKSLWRGTGCLFEIHSVRPDMAEELCDLLDLDRLAKRLNQTESSHDVEKYISRISLANMRIGRKLWGLCKQHLALRLSHDKSIRNITYGLANIQAVDPNMAEELCDLLDLNELQASVNLTEDPSDTGKLVATIVIANKEIAEELWALCKGELAAKLSQNWIASGGNLCIEYIQSASPDMARELCDLLDLGQLGARLHLTEDSSDVGNCVSTVVTANDHVGKELWSLCKGELATKLSRNWMSTDGIRCVEYIRSASPDMAKEICDLLNIGELAERLNQTEDLRQVGECIAKISLANERAGCELWGLCKENLASKVSCERYVLFGAWCVRDIHSGVPSMARELCDLLDVQMLARNMHRTKDLWEIGESIYIVFIANERVGQKLWGLCKESLATRLSRDRDMTGSSCILDIHRASHDMARELCQMLDLIELAKALGRRNCKHQRDFLQVIEKVDCRVHKKLTELMQSQ